MGTFLNSSIGDLRLNISDNNVTTIATSSLIDTLKTEAEESVAFLGDMITNIKEDVGDFIGNLGEEIDKTCGKVSDSAKSTLDTITEGWEKNALPILKEAGTDILNFLNDTAATLSTGVVSLTEGLLRFGEALVDLGTILNTATNSIGTGIYDGYQALRGLVTGEEWESATKAMWEGTKDFVATEHVKSWYDSLYNDTSFGNWMRDNGLFDSDKVREIGSGIGYVGGIIALTVLTFGAGGAAVGATGAGTAAGSAGITAGNMAVIAGLAGTGKGAETAWKDGAGIGEGLLYAGANGAWEAFQFWAGAKIGSPGGWGDKIAKSLFNGSKAAGSFSRIVLDSVDGGAEGFMQPFLKMLYKDTYTDENGNEVKLDDNILKRYAELFEQEGGMANVGGQAAFGGLLSALGEVGNLRNILKGEDNVRANPDTPSMPRQLTTAEVDAKMARYKYLKELEASEEYARFNANRGNAIVFSEYPHLEDIMHMTKELDNLEKELAPHFGTEVTADLSKVPEQLRRMDYNASTMKNEILDTINPNMNETTKARQLYIELNRRLSYDMNYLSGDKNLSESIYRSTKSFAELNGKSVICKGWSELYRELLIESGFDPSSVRIMGKAGLGEHKWIEITLSDGNIIIADATEIINNSIDLANCKSGCSTNGFVYVPPQYSGARLNRQELDFEDLSRAWLSTDEYLGYSHSGMYTQDLIKEANSQFTGRRLYEENLGKDKFTTTVENILKMDLPENSDGYDAFTYYKTIKKLIIDSDKSKDFNILISGNVTNSNVVEGVATLSIKLNENKSVFMVYSESTGKHIFYDVKDYLEYIKSLNIIKLKPPTF